ncbi:molybdate ABC transporter substrate-binding protein [Thermomonospora cellulosilytica]|uniref:Molybdate transport system substrate-binding protein n=1 Tax=Thermomonospora cellulosilytica TaxID=1411118 RepID=A0A7W3RAH4_9ACTN|nr:molybdate ABC transporter substrate-binding protein [Thermomonospora cellulosilytica]MBA9006388.1 molybdate transport system substrate-binding protein [Thermomonospora cellulosilytica]
MTDRIARRAARTVAALALAVAAAGCGDAGRTGGGGATLTVFAAASLTESFTELGRAFERSRPGVRVRFSFAGSSTLARQIAEGAPADVFAAADQNAMRTVAGARRTAAPRVFARNRLVIAIAPGNPGGVRSLRDLAGRRVKVVLCAAPVPCGAAARKALDAANVRVTPVSEEQDVKAVLTKVRMGEADAGLIYRTDVRASGGRVEGVEFPESAQAVNDYPIAPLTEAPEPGHAEAFVALVTSAQGRAVLAGAGFGLP